VSRVLSREVCLLDGIESFEGLWLRCADPADLRYLRGAGCCIQSSRSRCYTAGPQKTAVTNCDLDCIHPTHGSLSWRFFCLLYCALLSHN